MPELVQIMAWEQTGDMTEIISEEHVADPCMYLRQTIQLNHQGPVSI